MFAAFLLALCFLADKLYFFLLPEVFDRNGAVTTVTAYAESVSSNSINKHWAFCVTPSPSTTTQFVRENQSHLRQVCTGDVVKGEAVLTTQKLGKHCLAVCSCCDRVKQSCELPDTPFHDTGLSSLAAHFLPHWRGTSLHS